MGTTDESGRCLKILHVVSTLSPRAGGLAKAVASIAGVQCAAGHRVQIVQGGGDDGIAAAREAFGAFPGLNGVEIWSRPWWVPGGTGDFAPDAVHAHGLWEPILHWALARARAAGLPTVVTPHGMSSPWQDRRYRWIKSALRGPGGYRRRWRRATRIHVLSRFEEAHWRRNGYDRLARVPNGLFPVEFEDGHAPPRWAGPPDGTPYILFLGRLAEQKGPDILLEAFMRVAKAVPDVHLVFAGPDFGMERRLRARAAAGPSARVWFPGRLDTPTKWAALRHAVALAHPSRNEGHSLTLLEAAAVGCPVVMSDAAGFPELAEAGGARTGGVTGEAFAAPLADMIVDGDLHRNMGGRARALVRRAYTWDQLLPGLMDLYEGELLTPQG